MNKLVYYPNKSLSTACEPVIFPDPSLDSLIATMAEVMRKYNGVGLAANQIGINKQVLLVQTVKGPLTEVINPKVIELDGEVLLTEGCLSAPGIQLPIKRAEHVFFSYYDKEGIERKAVASGRDARVLQHELEHLQGQFYFDRVPAHVRMNAIKALNKNLK